MRAHSPPREQPGLASVLGSGRWAPRAQVRSPGWSGGSPQGCGARAALPQISTSALPRRRGTNLPCVPQKRAFCATHVLHHKYKKAISNNGILLYSEMTNLDSVLKESKGLFKNVTCTLLVEK